MAAGCGGQMDNEERGLRGEVDLPASWRLENLPILCVSRDLGLT
jgi:hypothetical protein